MQCGQPFDSENSLLLKTQLHSTVISPHIHSPPYPGEGLMHDSIGAIIIKSQVHRSVGIFFYVHVAHSWTGV